MKLMSFDLAGKKLTSPEAPAKRPNPQMPNCLRGGTAQPASQFKWLWWIPDWLGLHLVTSGERPEGFCGLVTGLTAIAHGPPLVITAEERNLSITKELNHPAPHVKDIFTVYMVNTLWFGGSTGFGSRQMVSKNA